MVLRHAADIVSGLTYVGVILVWLLPNIIGGFLPDVSNFINTLGVNAPLIVAIVFLALYRVDGNSSTKWARLRCFCWCWSPCAWSE